MPKSSKPKSEPRIIATGVDGDFDNAFADHVPHQGLNPYKDFVVQLIVYKDIPPRDPRFEFNREMGMSFLDGIMNLKSCGLGGNLLFMFPERWLSVHEQRAFMWALDKNPDKKKITRIRIGTSCPLIVGDFTREDVRIVSFQNEEERTVAARQ